jgi:hypothetical protein
VRFTPNLYKETRRRGRGDGQATTADALRNGSRTRRTRRWWTSSSANRPRPVAVDDQITELSSATGSVTS